jgi:hypothetical protein
VACRVLSMHDHCMSWLQMRVHVESNGNGDSRVVTFNTAVYSRLLQAPRGSTRLRAAHSCEPWRSSQSDSCVTQTRGSRVCGCSSL